MFTPFIKHSQSTYRRIFYDFARNFVRKRTRILRLIRIARYIGRLGPWRNLIIGIISKYLPNPPLEVREITLFPSMDIAHSVENITKMGWSTELRLPQNYLDKIFEFYKSKEFANLENPHNECVAISNIAHDPNIIEVARKYLGVEPILFGTNMYWSNKRSDKIRSHHIERKGFHYDVADFRSLTLLIYLTDVDADCGPHVLIENTLGKTLQELLKPSISYESAIKSYGKRIKRIVGKSGTMFFEDLTTYHQHGVGKKPRLMLTILYTFHRKPF